MFEIPNAKRVRREDLYDSSGGSGSEAEDAEADAALRSKLNAQLASLLDVDFSINQEAARAGGQNLTAKRQDGASRQQQRELRDEDEDEDGDEEMRDDSARHGGAPGDEDDEPVEFAFRLFSGEDPSGQKVVLENQDDGAADGVGNGGGGAFVVAKRPTSYYIAEEPSTKDCEKFRQAAVSHEYLLAEAGRARRWAVEKPWKVTTITITATKKTKTKDGGEVTKFVGKIIGSESEAVTEGRRTRPGKKRRIKLRTREKSKKEKEVVAKQQAAEKELHLLDKKKRLNRQKKLKRRAKAKEQKQQGDGAAGSDDDDASDGGKSVGSS